MNNNFSILPIYSGTNDISTATTLYKVISNNGIEWFTGSYFECAKFINQFKSE